MPNKKKLSVSDILNQAKAKQGFEKDIDFAEAFGVSKQSLWQWMNEVHKPSVQWLKLQFLLNPKSWQGKLCADLLVALGQEVPTAPAAPSQPTEAAQ